MVLDPTKFFCWQKREDVFLNTEKTMLGIVGPIWTEVHVGIGTAVRELDIE